MNKIKKAFSVIEKRLHNLVYPIKNFFAFLKKVFDYMPILWADRDYDYAYILYLLKYKIERTRDCIQANSLVASYEKQVKEMNEVIQLIDKHFNFDYYEKEKKKLEKKYGRLIWYSEDKLFSTYKNNSIRIMSKYEKENYRNYKQIRKDVKKSFDNEHKLQEKDWNKLFDSLKKNIRNWWD